MLHTPNMVNAIVRVGSSRVNFVSLRIEQTYGDPNRPYVMGSMYHANNGQGGQEENHLKSIITRSGHTIELDDAQESLGITIKDRNGNRFHLDSKGNNIEITALETITLKAKDIRFEAENNIEAQAGADIKADAMGAAHIGSQGNLDVTTQSDLQLKSIASTSLVADAQIQIIRCNRKSKQRLFDGYSRSGYYHQRTENHRQWIGS